MKRSPVSGQVGFDEGPIGVDLELHVVGDEADDAVGVGLVEGQPGLLHAGPVMLDPERAVGVQHDLDDILVVEEAADRRSQRRLEHAPEALAAKLMRLHDRPPERSRWV